MVEVAEDDRSVIYSAREAVGVFDNADALEGSVGGLEISGLDRADVSVLASDKTVDDRLGRLDSSVEEIVDDPLVLLAAFVSKVSRFEGEAAAVGVLLFVGGMAGRCRLRVGGGVPRCGDDRRGGRASRRPAGARLISHHHIERVQAQMAQGSVFWVGVCDDAAGARAPKLIKAGARDVHLHETRPEGTLKDRPFVLGQLDPFLVSDPAAP
jgi:hypothetical protein